MNRARRAVSRAAAVASAAALSLSACTATVREPSPEPSASAVGAGEGAAMNRNDVIAVMKDFAPEMEGLQRVGKNTPAMTSAREVAGHFGANAVVEVGPLACKPVRDALFLTTDEDRGPAGTDVVRFVGNYNETGEVPDLTADFVDPWIFMVARWFADEPLAATVPSLARDADCTAFEVTYPREGHVYRYGSSRADEVDLAGLPGLTVRLELEEQTLLVVDEAGALVDTAVAADEVGYVHASGPYAVVVMLTEIDTPEAVAARLISEFLTHVGEQP